MTCRRTRWAHWKGRLALAIVLLACLGTSRAQAHAIIMKSQPASGATLAATTVPVNLHFNSRIDHKRSIVALTDPAGNTAQLAIMPQSAADTILASARSLVPGNYTLHWQVLSVDGHLTRGDIPFTIVPASTP